MRNTALTKSILLATTLSLCVPASAGWMDKLGDFLNTEQTGAALTDSEVAAGLKQALQIGSETVVTQLSAPGGFNADPKVHIPLPDSLQTAQTYLDKVGMGDSLNTLENKLNEAAETATIKAKPLFIEAIKQLTWEDAKKILNGPDDAATQYFKNKMSSPLAKEMRPVVDQSLAEVGAVQAFNNVMGDYKKLPLVPDIQTNLTDHVLDKGIQGIFYYLGQEEAKIRNNPAERTTELLKKVFSR